jgi:Ca-activated chloride channel family protein
MKLRLAEPGSDRPNLLRNSGYVALLWLAVCGGLQAQQARLLPGPLETIRVTADVVLVPVLAMDRNDQYVSGLRKGDFTVYEDRVQQEIRYFTSEDVPVSVALLIDTSGSMARKLALANMAIREFLEASNPEDEFSLIGFSDDAHLLAPFTADRGKLEKWLPLLEARGWTALLDALDLALTQMTYARYPRKAIFLISDGGDNRSRHTETEIQRRVTEANVQIYSIGVINPFETEEQSGASLLSNIARSTGGRFFKVDDPNMLPETAKAIGMALRNQYVLGYKPATPKSDGRYHRIEVRLAQPKGSPKLTLSFRTSYLSPAD